MQIQTRDFGQVECAPEALIEFPCGLPGFEEEKSFVLLEREASRPLVFLQSATTPGLCFASVPVQTVRPNLEWTLSREDLQALGCEPDAPPSDPCEFTFLAILAGGEDGPTANLLAPVVIRRIARRGIQAVQADSPYGVCEPLWPKSGDKPC